MGCVESKNKKEAKVQLCRERRRLMKQLVGCRREFADSQLAYLKALKNIGVTLRQFTESEYIEPETSSPLPLLPSCIQPPPRPSFLSPEEQGEDENWAETNTEFEEEGVGTDGCVENVHSEKKEIFEWADDSSSMASCHTKDTEDRAMVVRRYKKKLTDVIRELDDYFLKAWDARQQIAVFLDSHERSTFHHQILKENKRKRYNSGKVFSVWSWNRPSKSLQFARDTIDCCDSNEPCRPGAHCVTLEKIYALEKMLYKEVKDEENLKLEHERKSLLLQKQEDEKSDLAKTDKTRHAVENLQCDILLLQQSISQTCSSLVRLKNEELYPQLVGITSGMMQMWGTMYESHQVQNHICQQLDNLNNEENRDPITDYHRQATIQLETEVSFWYHSFCRLISSQQDYLKALSEWVQYAKGLTEDHRENCSSSSISSLCQDWLLALDKLPHQDASNALKNLLTDVQSIVFQQVDERNRKKKLDKLKTKWGKELQSQKADTDRKLKASIPVGDTQLSLRPKHPISVKSDKTEALKNQCEIENDQHLLSVHLCRAMTLTNLQRSLPGVFRSLMVFSAACVQAFESIQKQTEPEACDEEAYFPPS